MPGLDKTRRRPLESRLDDFEDIEIVKNLLELRTHLRRENESLETSLD